MYRHVYEILDKYIQPVKVLPKAKFFVINPDNYFKFISNIPKIYSNASDD